MNSNLENEKENLTTRRGMFQTYFVDFYSRLLIAKISNKLVLFRHVFLEALTQEKLNSFKSIYPNFIVVSFVNDYVTLI